jgi:5-(carboxyamino)imidazole ribonucleotide synthase
MNRTDKAFILGHGQLAWMLETQGRKLGLEISCVDKDFNPKETQIVTFESEFYNPVELAPQTRNLEVFPSLENLKNLQDRLSQKQSLVRSQLKTSPFGHFEASPKVLPFFEEQGPLVAKKRTGGYDGYGTFILKNKKSLNEFLNLNENLISQFIFEKWIPFDREVALQVARSRKGDIQFFPLVETQQKDNKCFLVLGPLHCPKPLQNKIKKWLDKINYVGVMGIEFFQLGNELLINEVAPRVHNTGHHTLDSCSVDQFTMHWLCALQDKLPEIEVKTSAFAMLNLIGQSSEEVQFPKNLDGHLYWYKKSNRPGRKLGHINWTGKNKKALEKKALSHLKKWKL